MKMDPEIIIIGAAVIDILVRPADEAVFETGSYPAEEIRMSTGADALNEETILAKLGKRVYLETVIGADRAGEYILEHCRRCGIETGDDCIRREIPTGINVVLVRKNGERHFLTDSNSTLRKLTLNDIHLPFYEKAGIVCFASIFVFPQIGAHELELVFSQAKKQGKVVCADMTKRKNNESAEDLACALKYVDYLIPNDEEAMLLTGKDTVEEAACELSRTGTGTVVVKCGPKGCYLLEKSRKGEWIEAEANVNSVDTTGAGDSFAAGFIYAMSEGRNLRECARYGNLFGARAVECIGATDWLEKKENQNTIKI